MSLALNWRRRRPFVSFDWKIVWTLPLNRVYNLLKLFSLAFSRTDFTSSLTFGLLLNNCSRFKFTEKRFDVDGFVVDDFVSSVLMLRINVGRMDSGGESRSPNKIEFRLIDVDGKSMQAAGSTSAMVGIDEKTLRSVDADDNVISWTFFRRLVRLRISGAGRFLAGLWPVTGLVWTCASCSGRTEYLPTLQSEQPFPMFCAVFFFSFAVRRSLTTCFFCKENNDTWRWVLALRKILFLIIRYLWAINVISLASIETSNERTLANFSVGLLFEIFRHVNCLFVVRQSKFVSLLRWFTDRICFFTFDVKFW